MNGHGSGKATRSAGSVDAGSSENTRLPEEDTYRGVRSVLIKGASGSFVLKVAGSGLVLLCHIGLARTLGSENYGIYTYVLACMSILAVVCLFGLDTSALRFVSRYQSQRQWGLLRGFFKYSRWIHVLTCFPAVLAVVAGRSFLEIGSSQEVRLAFLIGAIVVPLLVHMRMCGAVLQAFKRVVLAQIPELVVRPCILLAGVVLFYLWRREHVSAHVAILFNVAGLAVGILLLWWFLRHVLPKETRASRPEFAIRLWSRVSATFFIVAGSEVLRLHIGIILTARYLGATQAGIFAAANGLVRLVGFGLIAINTIAGPMISELYAARKMGVIQRLLRLAAWGAFLYFLVSGLVMVVWGDRLLGFFGAEFVAGYSCLMILVAGRLSDSMTGLVHYTMVMTDHHAAAMKIQLFSVAIQIGLSVVLIPTWGIAGAAVASAAAMITWDVLALVYVRIKLGLNPSILPMRRRTFQSTGEK